MQGIYNKSKKTILAKQFGMCKTLWSKARGLMFSKIKPLVFLFPNERIIRLHSFFVFAPIDLVFLNKKGFVVDLKRGWKPFSFYCSKRKAAILLELPAGAINKTKTKICDKIITKKK